MPKTNFFDREPRKLPRSSFESKVYGSLLLEKCDYAKSMLWRELARTKLAFYKEMPFPPIGQGENVRDINLTEDWTNTAAVICVMQVGEPDDLYSFEEIVASSVTDEDEYNMLVEFVNDLNSKVEEDPKASLNPAQ